ncbi:MAG: metallophosphoesterase [Ignavibacteria bacterium]|nr:metallophosphoesterase [Ignavibacteria bacterium]
MQQAQYFSLLEVIQSSLSLNNVRSDEDSSGFSSDGPVVIHEDGNIISYSVRPDQNSFKAYRDQIKAEDVLTCYVDKSGQQFSFKLKESISIEPDVYDLPDKMLIVSDIEGNFTGFKMILTAAGVVNNELDWTFGNGHVVLPGDFFDRGINVTECLWLIYKLETEAERQGGKVHFILGNHELMNLKNDLRYVRAKYFANADSLKLDYKNWYEENSELGKWLRSKNSIEKIGDFLFMHAGLSKDFPGDSLSLTEINNNIRASIDKTFNKGEASKDIFIGSNGPLWYRGIVKETETQEEVEKTLTAFNASKMILGHTIVDQIKYLYNNRVIAIDLDHQENADKGVMYALWYENGDFFIIDNNGSKNEL